MMKADKYQGEAVRVNVPRGAVAMVQVVVFDDESIHVGGPALSGYGEEQLVEALKLGLETLGFEATLSGSGGRVEVTGVHSRLAPTEAIA